MNETAIFYSYKTPIGLVTIGEKNKSIFLLYFGLPKSIDNLVFKETPLLKLVQSQLQEYFTGKRKAFDLPTTMQGTAFQMHVWNSLAAISYATTKTYAEIAATIDNEKAARAVGYACNQNPLPIIVPCHRVIGSDGDLVGYGGGVKIKAFLLDLEKQYSTT